MQIDESIKNLKIFISGPMTGYEHFNFEKFDFIESQLKKYGFKDIVNPANICRKYKVENVLANNNIFDKMIIEEQEAEKTCNAIILLDGWEKSVGVKRELKTAIDLGFEILLERNFTFL